MSDFFSARLLHVQKLLNMSYILIRTKEDEQEGTRCIRSGSTGMLSERVHLVNGLSLQIEAKTINWSYEVGCSFAASRSADCLRSRS